MYFSAVVHCWRVHSKTDLHDAPAMSDQVTFYFSHPAVFRSRSLFAFGEDTKLPGLFSKLAIADNFISWNCNIIL